MSNEYNKLKTKHLLIIIIFSSAIIAFAIWFLIFCRVKTVNIYNNVYTVSEDIVVSSKIKAGNHMFGLDLNQSKTDILKNNSYIKSVKIDRKLFDEINISVVEYKPLFYTSYENEKYVLSIDLHVLGKYEGDTETVYGLRELVLPKLKTCEIGKKLELDDGVITEYEEILKTLSESGLGEGISRFSLKSKYDLEVLYNNKYTLVFGSHKDLSKKISTCIRAIEYISSNTPNVTGVLYAYSPDEVSFQITGGA